MKLKISLLLHFEKRKRQVPFWFSVRLYLRPFFFKRGLFSPPKWIWVTIHTEMCYFSRIVGFQNFVKSCLACSLLRQSPLKITWPNTICFHMKKICGKPTSEIFVALSRISGRKSCFLNDREVFYKSKKRYFDCHAHRCCHTQEKAPLEGDSLDESPAGCYRLENRSIQFMPMYLPLSDGACAWSLTHFSGKIFAS